MQIYIYSQGQKKGPFSPDELRSSLAAGAFQPTDLAWHEGALDWQPLSSFSACGGDISPAVPYRVIPAPPTSGLAIASLVLGIVSLLTSGLTSIPAVICGHMSLGQIKREAGNISGGGLALAGLIMGYVGLAMLVFMISMMISLGFMLAAGLKHLADTTAAHAPNAASAEASECRSHAGQIARACDSYAKDHQGHYPQSLTDLLPKYIPNRLILSCPMLKDDAVVGYNYFAGSSDDPPTKVLLISKGETSDQEKVTATRDGETSLENKTP